MFKVGDLAVYPAQGVGVIEAIEEQDLMGSTQSFYIMKIFGSNMKIMIPLDSVKSAGLRSVISAGEIPRIYEILKEKDVTIDKQTWNKRYRDYLEKIKTGSVYEVARVLRDLCILKLDKDLSFGERKNDGHGEKSLDQRNLSSQQIRRNESRRRHKRLVPDARHDERRCLKRDFFMVHGKPRGGHVPFFLSWFV